MVHKEVIWKSINDSIDKCKKESYQLSSLSNRVKGALNKFAESTRNLDHEKAVVINGNGEVIAEYDDNIRYHVHIPLEDAIGDIITDKCKDILEEYDRVASQYNEDELILVRDGYQRRINERLNSLGSEVEFHVDHNHPGAYQTANMDYNVFTSLSDGDMNYFHDAHVRIKSPNGETFFINNCVRSITAECSNGSRMTLVNHKSYGESIYSGDFNNARDRLLINWRAYLMYCNKGASDYTGKLLENYDGGASSLSRDDLNSIRRGVNKYLKKEGMVMFPQMIKNNIREFDDLGVELRVDWL